MGLKDRSTVPSAGFRFGGMALLIERWDELDSHSREEILRKME